MTNVIFLNSEEVLAKKATGRTHEKYASVVEGSDYYTNILLLLYSSGIISC